MWFLLVLIPFIVVFSVAGAAIRRRHNTSYASVDLERSRQRRRPIIFVSWAPAEGV